MAAAKSKKTTGKGRHKKGGRKLEFTIYLAGVLLVALVALGIWHGLRALTHRGGEASSAPSAPSVVSSAPSSAASVAADSGDSAPSAAPTASSKAASSKAASKAEEEPEESSAPRAPKGDYIPADKTGAAELDEWYLFVVNPANPISSGWQADMTYLDSEYRLDSRIIEPYNDMVEAAAADGVSLYPVSCYRSYDTQDRLYRNRVERAKNENPSFTQQQAEDYAATFVARPGTSEHQTGLAIDFNSVETDFGSTEAGRWLKAHANDYGFILRYEKEKQPLTGVTWEPWHYRFVGVRHAKRMTELGYCLEEYVDYLKNGG